MSFAIEVTGEAIPLNLRELGRALHAATSHDDLQRRSAVQQIQAWESCPDYFSSLQATFLDKSLGHEIRFLAIILLKNGIDRHWRHTAKNAIRPAEKQLIRSRLLQGSVDEEDGSLSLHNALVVAKVVRVDYPQEWPGALDTIVETAKTTKTEPGTRGGRRLAGALLVLLRVVKELSTARIARFQMALRNATPRLMQPLGELYTERTAAWMESVGKGGAGGENETALAMRNSLTALKILRRLTTRGYDEPHEARVVAEFWSLSQQQFDQLLSTVGQGWPVSASWEDLMGKHLLQFTKLHIDMCETHPTSFPVLPQSIALVRAYWGLIKNLSEVFEKSEGIKQTSSDGADQGKPRHEGPLLERLALKGIILIRGCVALAHKPVHTFRYRSHAVKEQEMVAVNMIKTKLLTKEFLLDVVRVIIRKLFLFRQSDLEAWEEEAEEWESQERNEGSAFEWAVKPAAERLLLDLISEYKDLGQPLLDYCQLATQVDMDVVAKEAVYTALGCAAQHVYDQFDFDQLLKMHLVRDVQIDHGLAKILRRRIAILLGQWITVRIARENRSIVYEIFGHLMRADDRHNDKVVRITAARQLRIVMRDFDSEPTAFLPVAPATFAALIHLLDEVGLDETKLAILETLRAVVDHLDKHVSQFGDAIMAALSKLWGSSGADAYMIKQAVLAITETLVVCMRAESQRYQASVVPLLAEAMSPDSALHFHLVDESVELWRSILVQSVPPLAPGLTKLAALALPMVEHESPIAKKCLELVKNYVVLAPETMLSDELRRPSLVALAKTLGSRSGQQAQLGTASIEHLLCAAADLGGGAAGVAVVVRDMLAVDLVSNVLQALQRAFEAGQTTGPTKMSRISAVTEDNYFTLLARMAVADPAMFVDVLKQFARSSNESGDDAALLAGVWTWLAPEWFASFDAMAEMERQKLSCLALTRLAELPVESARLLVLDRLQDYLAMWTSVVALLREGADDADTSVAADTLVWATGDQDIVNEWDTALDAREREAAAKDPIHTVRTYPFVVERLQDLIGRSGGPDVFANAWLVNVDRAVLQAFQQLARPGAPPGRG